MTVDCHDVSSLFHRDELDEAIIGRFQHSRLSFFMHSVVAGGTA